MTTLRPFFLKHVAQTSTTPVMLEPARAEGIYIHDTDGKRYTDLNSGYCVSVLGHGHPRVVAAVQQQAAVYMHTTVYGEHVQSPQVLLAQKLTAQLDSRLNAVYFVNSGAEAVEGAMKLARRATGRPGIVACHKAYHGSTQGADSLRSDLDYTGAFMPLLPGIRNIWFNRVDDLALIDSNTAAVIIEPIQGEAGVILPSVGYLEALRKRCDETGALLIFDEIQTGMGRTGTLMAHQGLGVVPDVLLLAKSFGGGMPLGAFISSRELMQTFTIDPALGHLTTFGGHPVCCAAGLAALEVLLEHDLIGGVQQKSQLFVDRLSHPAIIEIRRHGLMMAVEMDPKISMKDFMAQLFGQRLLSDWFLFNDRAFRIAPPLIITEDQIDETCDTIMGILRQIWA